MEREKCLLSDHPIGTGRPKIAAPARGPTCPVKEPTRRTDTNRAYLSDILSFLD